RSRRCLQLATRAAGSRLSYGPFARVGSARGRSTSSSWAAPSCRDRGSCAISQFAEGASMTDIVSLGLTRWRPPQSEEMQQTALRTMEGGGVLVLQKLEFELSDDERRFLSPRWSDDRAKNISLERDTLKGARGEPRDLADLAGMISRFARCAADL